jgi:hypothetical protein
MAKDMPKDTADSTTPYGTGQAPQAPGTTVDPNGPTLVPGGPVPPRAVPAPVHGTSETPTAPKNPGGKP